MGDDDYPRMSPAEKPASIPMPIRWLLRLAFCFCAVWLLVADLIWLAEGKLVTDWSPIAKHEDNLERLANWTSVVWPFATFYIAFIEPHILAWLINQVRFFLGLEPWTRKSKILEGSEAAPTTRRVPEKTAGLATAKGSMKTSNAKPTTKVQSDHGWTEQWVFPLLIASVLIMPICAGFLNSSSVDQEKTEPPISRETPHESPPVSERENVEIDTIEDANTSTALEAGEPIFSVRAGDSCYEIAEACTGNGERFIELGAPLNAWLDVSNREYCLIRPGEELSLPRDWDKGCTMPLPEQ